LVLVWIRVPMLIPMIGVITAGRVTVAVLTVVWIRVPMLSPLIGVIVTGRVTLSVVALVSVRVPLLSVPIVVSIVGRATVTMLTFVRIRVHVLTPMIVVIVVGGRTNVSALIFMRLRVLMRPVLLFVSIVVIIGGRANVAVLSSMRMRIPVLVSIVAVSLLVIVVGRPSVIVLAVLLIIVTIPMILCSRLRVLLLGLLAMSVMDSLRTRFPAVSIVRLRRGRRSVPMLLLALPRCVRAPMFLTVGRVTVTIVVVTIVCKGVIIPRTVTVCKCYIERRQSVPFVLNSCFIHRCLVN
jgi:hypothetical protein